MKGYMKHIKKFNEAYHSLPKESPMDKYDNVDQAISELYNTIYNVKSELEEFENDHVAEEIIDEFSGLLEKIRESDESIRSILHKKIVEPDDFKLDHINVLEGEITPDAQEKELEYFVHFKDNGSNIGDINTINREEIWKTSKNKVMIIYKDANQNIIGKYKPL